MYQICNNYKNINVTGADIVGFRRLADPQLIFADEISLIIGLRCRGTNCVYRFGGVLKHLKSYQFIWEYGSLL